eukprot:13162512-Ditylum_brightwellii.AAC.1
MAAMWKTVPARTDLITSPEVYEKLLIKHNAYVDSVESVAVEGLHLFVLEKDIAVDDDNVTV